MNMTPLSSQRLFHFHCSIGALFYSNQTNTILSQRQVTLSSKSNLCAFEMEYPKTLKNRLQILVLRGHILTYLKFSYMGQSNDNLV